MCGIFGYIGPNNAVEVVLEGIKKLEYRGYDSAGIAGLKDGELIICKEAGKVSVLEQEVKKSQLKLDLAIGHTRWATHGKPNQINAHPHFDNNYYLALVHNGIIENYDILKKKLIENGVKFVSETDTEVVAQLLGYYYEGDILATVKKVIPMLKGSYAIAFIHKDYPGQIVAFTQELPLIIGLKEDETFLSSDPNALVNYTREVVFLSNSEIAILKANSMELHHASLGPITRKTTQLDSVENQEITKGGFEHYTLKEIFEQPQTITNALLSRYLEEYGTAIFDGIEFDELQYVQRIVILGCGTSYHAGCIGSYMIQDKARIPVEVEISSEFRYKNPIVPPGTFAIAISQSGETADTIAAIRELKAKGCKVLAICNVQGSTIAREADYAIFLRAGPEIGVCSTKAFTSQVVVLALLTLLLARKRHMSKQEGQEFLNALKLLPQQVRDLLTKAPEIKAIAKKYAHYDNFFFVGRRYMFPTSLEGALKLKEIAYINANGYPAGEMKHGPIALINENCPTVALCANKMTYEKLLSNLMEIKARNGYVIAIVDENEKGLGGIADDIIHTPSTIDELACVLTTVVTQLLAYYIARERGTEIDQPRNLAKSVTVE